MHTKNIFKLTLVLLLSITSIQAFWATGTKAVTSLFKITKSNQALHTDEIVQLSKLSDEAQGTVKVGKYLGSKNLPNHVLEDAYLRMAVHQNKISRYEAESFYKNLSGVEGFRTTIRKAIGNNVNGTSGHLNELRIANQATQSGIKVVAIGKKFDDGIKNSLTDIDILLRKNKKDILIEAKNYGPNSFFPVDKFKADLETLVIYGEKFSPNGSLKIFSFTQKPSNDFLLKQYEYWSNRKGVQLIFGSPQEQIEQIKMLEKIF